MKAVLLATALIAATPALAQTPYLVKDIRPGASGSSPSAFVATQSGVVFVANDGTNGPELWTSNGTADGTTLLLDVTPGTTGSQASGPASTGSWGCLQLRAEDFSTTVRMYCTDGTPSSVASVLPDSVFAGSKMLGFDGALWMSVTGALTFSSSVWKTDGTRAGTSSAAYLPRATATVLGAATSRYLYVTQLPTQQSPFTLWRTDGSAAGTEMVASNLSSSALAAFGDRILFATTATSGPSELWMEEGATKSKTRLAAVTPNATSQGLGGAALGTVFLFAGSSASDNSDAELWRTDGTSAGTYRLADLCAGSCSSTPVNFQRVGNLVYFSATDATAGRELWRTDGTPQGTGRVADLRSGAPDSAPSELVAAGSRLFFRARNDQGQSVLWRLDGTPGATPMQVVTAESAPLVDPLGLTLSQRSLFVRATSGGSGAELWVVPDAVDTASEAPEAASVLALRPVGARSVNLTAPAGAVRVEAFDLLGRFVARLHDGDASGSLRLALPAGLGAGAYLVRATTASGETTSALVRAR